MTSSTTDQPNNARVPEVIEKGNATIESEADDYDDDFDIEKENTQQQQSKGILAHDPPMSRGERYRDTILSALDHTVFQSISIAVALLIIADGGFFFFLLIGSHRMCSSPSKTDCEPRNWWYNWSMQVLNVLITYMSVVSMPWICTNLIHIMGWGCPKRKNEIGCDLYGLQTKTDAWFYIPLRRRFGITFILLWNCLFQFINQGTRIKYNTYELQTTSPGRIWTNIFFLLKFLCAGVGTGWLVYECGRVRKRYASTGHEFGLGPIDTMIHRYRLYRGIIHDESEEMDSDSNNVTLKR